MKNPETIFVGVSWPYANGDFHLGHLAGQNIVCDVFSRFHRQKGNNVLMVSGTDAHGTPATVKATEQGVTPQEVAKIYYNMHVKTSNKLNIQWDFYSTTESKVHKKVAKNLFKVIFENGFIFPKDVKQYYDEKACKFLADRYIVGTCPYCGYTEARGDQCNEGCEKLLDPTELLNPRSRLSDTIPVLKNHVVLYFDLSKLQEQIQKFVSTKESIWRNTVFSVAKKWLDEGLRPRPVTRELGYGVQVPIEEYNDKDIYVWFEAVMGYLSASIEWASNTDNPSAWEDFWKDPEAKHYYFIAKDNIPFHTILWPAIIMAYNDKYNKKSLISKLPGEVLNQKLNLPYDIPANQFLNLQGGEGKVSKSKGTTLTASQLIDQYNVDLIRYFFVRNAPENHDRDFVFRDFVNINNQELVGIFGNFIYRTLSFLDSRLNNDLNPKDYTVSPTVKTKIEKTFNKVGNELSHCKFVKASEEFMSLARFGNKYFNDNTPWVTLKNDIEECKQTIYDCIQIIYALAIIAKPFMPDTSKKILLQLGVHKKKKIPWEYKELKEVSQNKSPIPLFSKLENVKDN